MLRVKGERYGKKIGGHVDCGGLKVSDMGRKHEDMWRVKGGEYGKKTGHVEG